LGSVNRGWSHIRRKTGISEQKQWRRNFLLLPGRAKKSEKESWSQEQETGRRTSLSLLGWAKREDDEHCQTRKQTMPGTWLKGVFLAREVVKN